MTQRSRRHLGAGLLVYLFSLLKGDVMNAQVRKLDCNGRTIWRLMATREGVTVPEIGHMIDFDTQDDAEATALNVARRNRWAVCLQTYYTPGRPAGSTRTVDAPAELIATEGGAA